MSLGREYGLTRGTIFRIITYRRWDDRDTPMMRNDDE